MLLVDPYVKHKITLNRNNPQIVDTNALKNKSQSKTGVNFRWNKGCKYAKLTKEQQTELYELQMANKQVVKKHQIVAIQLLNL